jgi:hypothetical protein
MMRRHTWLIAAALAAGGAGAQTAASSDAGARPMDPGRPPQAVLDAAHAERRAARSASAPGLDARVEAQLRASFDAADRAHRGHLTRDEARAGGFGWISEHFDEIDTRHAGEVSFDDVKRYLKLGAAPAAR